MVAPRGHAPSTVSRLPRCLGDSNVGICHEVVRVVGGAENTSARNDNDDWIDTCRPQALGLVNKYRIVLSKLHELHSPGSASQISAVVLSYIAGISLAGRAKWRFGIGATILGAVRVIAEPNLERDMLCFTPGVLFGCAQRSTQLGESEQQLKQLSSQDMVLSKPPGRFAKIEWKDRNSYLLLQRYLPTTPRMV